MGYRVNKRSRKDGRTYWRLIFERWENGERHDQHIPSDQFLQHGFSPQMTTEEAKARAKQLNAQDKLKKREQRKMLAALKRAKDDELLVSAHLPDPLVREFQEIYLRRKFGIGPTPEVIQSKYEKALSHWHYVRRMVKSVNLPPKDWADEARSFYQYFAEQESSPEYVAKLLRVLNLWGYFFSKKINAPFLPVPAPTGYDRQLIQDAYTQADKPRKESDGLTVDLLKAGKGKLPASQYRWLFISLWFGLRPREVDGLRQQKNYRVEQAKGKTVLRVYQSKLVGIPADKRWKPIPCLFSEQLEALKMIQEGDFRRPLPKTIKKYVGERISLYGGRKGFVDLMLERDQQLVNISVWMGHATIERTWRSYKNKDDVQFDEPKAA